MDLVRAACSRVARARLCRLIASWAARTGAVRQAVKKAYHRRPRKRSGASSFVMSFPHGREPRGELPVVTGAGLFRAPTPRSTSYWAPAVPARRARLRELVVCSVAGGTITIDSSGMSEGAAGHRSRRAGTCRAGSRTVFRQLRHRRRRLRVSLKAGEAGRRLRAVSRVAQRRTVRAGLLAGGEQLVLVIARALLTKPKVLLIGRWLVSRR